MRKFLSTITFFLLIPFSTTLQSHPSSFADLVENLSPAVVSIASTTIVKDNNNSQNQIVYWSTLILPLYRLYSQAESTTQVVQN